MEEEWLKSTKGLAFSRNCNFVGCRHQNFECLKKHFLKTYYSVFFQKILITNYAMKFWQWRHFFLYPKRMKFVVSWWVRDWLLFEQKTDVRCQEMLITRKVSLIITPWWRDKSPYDTYPDVVINGGKFRCLRPVVSEELKRTYVGIHV